MVDVARRDFHLGARNDPDRLIVVEFEFPPFGINHVADARRRKGAQAMRHAHRRREPGHFRPSQQVAQCSPFEERRHPSVVLLARQYFARRAGRVVAAEALGLGIAKDTVQVLKDSGSGFEHIALVDVFNGFGDDGRRNAGDGKFADGGVDVALESACRLGVVPGAPFLLFHDQPFLCNGLKGVVGTGGMHGATDPAMADRVFAFEQQGFDLDELDARRSQTHKGISADRVGFSLPSIRYLMRQVAPPAGVMNRYSPPPSASFLPRSALATKALTPLSVSLPPPIPQP